VYCVCNRDIHKPFMIKKNIIDILQINFHNSAFCTKQSEHTNKTNLDFSLSNFFFLLSFPLPLFSHHTRKPHSPFLFSFLFPIFFPHHPCTPCLYFFLSPTTHIHLPSPISFFFFFSHFLLTFTPLPHFSGFFLLFFLFYYIYIYITFKHYKNYK
jgi:hypothetical protein